MSGTYTSQNGYTQIVNVPSKPFCLKDFSE